MAKKIDEAEVKKECPSCGLGVALDATVCEFCGWDFEEEDEWILQIEKLERDLMLEKQKFEPGTVNEKIESTLHAPTLERIEAARAAQKPAIEVQAKAPHAKPSVQEPVGFQPSVTSVKPKTKAMESAVPPAPTQKVRRVRTVKASPGQVVEQPPEARSQATWEEVTQPEAVKKTRIVRKIKQ